MYIYKHIYVHIYLKNKKYIYTYIFINLLPFEKKIHFGCPWISSALNFDYLRCTYSRLLDCSGPLIYLISLKDASKEKKKRGGNICLFICNKLKK